MTASGTGELQECGVCKWSSEVTGLRKMWRFSLVTEKLVSSQEELCFTKSVSQSIS